MYAAAAASVAAEHSIGVFQTNYSVICITSSSSTSSLYAYKRMHASLLACINNFLLSNIYAMPCHALYHLIFGVQPLNVQQTLEGKFSTSIPSIQKEKVKKLQLAFLVHIYTHEIWWQTSRLGRIKEEKSTTQTAARKAWKTRIKKEKAEYD